MRVLAICGSLRKKSMNLALLRTAAELAPPGMEIVIHPLHDIPLFNDDVNEAGIPAPVTAFLDAITAADGLLFAVPEYNHAYPGVLKNALDYASHPETLKSKPVTMVSAAPGPGGGVRGQLALREVLFAHETHVMPHYELLLRAATKKIGADGLVADEETRTALGEHLADFAEYIRSHTAAAAV